MCFMQEERWESVSVNYAKKDARFHHWVIRISRALVRYLLLGGGSSETFPERKQNPMMLGQNLQKRTESTNEIGNVEYADSHNVLSRNKQQVKRV